jgi:hypothetical protein
MRRTFGGRSGDRAMSVLRRIPSTTILYLGLGAGICATLPVAPADTSTAALTTDSPATDARVMGIADDGFPVTLAGWDHRLRSVVLDKSVRFRAERRGGVLRAAIE